MATKRVQAKRLTEWVDRPLAGTSVDRTAGTIDGVLICGTSSANGRDYPVAVLKRDCAKYEGRPVNCDHSRDSTVERRLGWFTNVRPGPDGRPRGKLHLLKSHPMYERVMEAAERNPALFGFSHVALCDTRPGTGGREMVEAIRSVESIDLVAQPATTKGLFEGTAVKIRLSELIEAAIPKLAPERVKPVRRALVLAEDDGGMAPMLDTPVDPPAEGADGDDAIKGGIRGIAVAILDDDSLSTEEKLKKLRLALQMGEKMSGKVDATPSKASDGAASAESQQVKLTDVIAECVAMGVKDPTGRQLAALVEIPTAAGRALVIEGMKGAAQPERPSSAGRARITESAGGGTGKGKGVAEGAPPSDPKEFAEWLK